MALLRRKYFIIIAKGRAYAWEENETTKLQLKMKKKGSRKYSAPKPRYVPTAYIRLIHQLQLEIQHANKNDGHEAQRRGSYAARVLDKFGEEVNGEHQLEKAGPYASAWRSKVLTPTLQRQVQGVPDVYWPSTHAGILDPEDEDSDNLDRDLTIEAATKFYLSRDPTCSQAIKSYYRNLVYIREMRWHLGVLLTVREVADVGYFNLTLKNQDIVMEPDTISPDLEEGPPGSVPPFSETEVLVLASEGLEPFLRKWVVSVQFLSVELLIPIFLTARSF